jgi:hypothetical protein
MNTLVRNPVSSEATRPAARRREGEQRVYATRGRSIRGRHRVASGERSDSHGDRKAGKAVPLTKSLPRKGQDSIINSLQGREFCQEAVVSCNCVTASDCEDMIRQAMRAIQAVRLLLGQKTYAPGVMPHLCLVA